VVQLGLSTGVACFPDDGETTEELLTVAAGHMQNDKRARKTVIALANAPVNNIDVFR
jgi:predicted signal transduction protein with EAL and GGDEF domain